ncbi:MAG TPA: BadF/BadG/BcrA/BcrD ATPase family protein [Meiothermus sp.]|nr:BadF/BadG/BcrA/BcrD ATPase family protein [Meiothermus sp.]
MSVRGGGGDGLFRVGVDAGGTKVRAVLARRLEHELQILGRGTAGSANPRQVGLTQAHAEIRAAIEAAFRVAGLEPAPERCLVHVGSAGLATAEDVIAFESQHPYARLEAQSDATLALSAYFAGDPGVLLIVGTGCIALARGSDGKLYRRMGWGFPLEVGGGAWLGLEALRLALGDLEAHRDSELARRLKAEFDSPRGVMEWIRGKSSGDYARFARWVFEVADARCRGLLERWSDIAQRLVAELQGESGAAQVGVWGGLRKRLLERVKLEGYTEPKREPLEQALILADRLIGSASTS